MVRASSGTGDRGVRRLGNRLKSDAIAAELRSEIRSGVLGSGSLMPTEHDIASRFDVSRGTVRSALAKLADEDLIATRNGVGSFVTFDSADIDGTLGWARQLSAAGVEVQAEVLRIAAVVDPELAAEVGSSSMSFVAVDRVRRLPDGRAVSLERSRVPDVSPISELPVTGLPNGSLTEVLRIAAIVDPELAAEVGSSSMSFVAVDRVRRLPDGRAVSLERSRVPDVGPIAELPVSGLPNGSLTEALRSAGLVPHRGEQWLSVVPVTGDDAAILGVDDGTPHLHSIRVSRDSSGRFVEKVVSLLATDRFRVHLTFGV